MAKQKDVNKKSGTGKHDSLIKKISRFLSDERFKVSLGVFVILATAFLTLAFISYLSTWSEDQSKLTISWRDLLANSDITVENWTGKTGAWLANLFIYRWFGLPSLAFLLLFLLLGLRLMNIKLLPLGKTTRYVIFLVVWTSVALGLIFGEGVFYPGGSYGYFISHWINSTVGKVGTAFILLISAFVFAVVVFKDFLTWVRSLIRKAIPLKNEEQTTVEDQEQDCEYNQDVQENNDELLGDEDIQEEELISFDLSEEESESNELPVVGEDFDLEIERSTPESIEDTHNDEISDGDDDDIGMSVERLEEETVDSEESIIEGPLGDFDPKLDLSFYKYPPFDLLEDYESGNSEVSQQELIANKDKIIQTLKNYGIEITKIKATIGPTVTLYEIVPAPGVKISKIRSLEDDIALSLAALGIRIIAPIPGKGTIGIEVPNQNPETVSIKSVLSSQRFQESKAELPVAMGKTIQNETFVFDLAKAPHLLVAGATGQGKSVGINTILASLLYKKHPAELKFVLVDPKKVELSLYSKIEKHFLAKLEEEDESIITDTQRVVKTLRSLTVEMDARYDLLKSAGVRQIKEYNAKFIKRQLNPNKGHRYLPYIVVVVDEFADLIQTAGREIEDPIARIAQLARAVGIHLVIATQRPSTNIITGSIKANFPARIAFRVSSMVDSRTILDSPGANQLIGRGDMLISLGSDLVRIQCAFVDTPELEKLIEFISEQQGYPHPLYLPEVLEEAGSGIADIDLQKRDDLFNEAARLIVQYQQGSTSLVQRKFSIGYNRAGRIIDQLEAAGIVGPYEGSKARQVLIQDLYALEQFLNDVDSKNN